jgi:hypothetical protein
MYHHTTNTRARKNGVRTAPETPESSEQPGIPAYPGGIFVLELAGRRLDGGENSSVC